MSGAISLLSLHVVMEWRGTRWQREAATGRVLHFNNNNNKNNSVSVRGVDTPYSDAHKRLCER
jgi:hypothetical protein